MGSGSGGLRGEDKQRTTRDSKECLELSSYVLVPFFQLIPRE